jgi:opacity protein-like surface antigen
LALKHACSGAALCVALWGLASNSAQAGGPENINRSVPGFYDWAGLYAGIHAGGLANYSDISDPLGPSLFGNANHATGGFAGGQIGYNFQDGHLVYGFEADVSLPDIEGTSTCSSLSGSFVNSNCRAGIDAFGTLAARLGTVFGPGGRGLLYGKAGAAWYDGDLDLATNDSTLGEKGNFYGVRKNALSHWGWTVGAGVEYALTGNWSAKAEYDYANFGRQSVTLTPSAFLDNDGDVVELASERRGRLSNDFHAFKIGLNYHFGLRAQPDDGDEPASVKDAAPSVSSFGIEVGGRYWYSWGRHKYDLGLMKNDPVPDYSLISRLTYDDTEASTGEAVMRVTAPWNLFAKGFVGGGSIASGRMTDEDYNIPGDTVASIPYSNTISKVSGDIPAYGTLDLGYDWWRERSYRLGTYIGYNYYRETMGAYGVTQTANPLGPLGPDVGGPIPPTGHAVITQEATWQSLRLGAAGDFRLAPGVRLSWDAAYLPYVSVDAEDRHYLGNTSGIASINPLRGHGTGAQLEVMLSYDLTERLSLGVGARYWAMWTSDGYFTRTYSSDGPVPPSLPRQHLKIETERLGVLGELLYKF